MLQVRCVHAAEWNKLQNKKSSKGAVRSSAGSSHRDSKNLKAVDSGDTLKPTDTQEERTVTQLYRWVIEEWEETSQRGEIKKEEENWKDMTQQ